jgi:hypothetical protein
LVETFIYTVECNLVRVSELYFLSNNGEFSFERCESPHESAVHRDQHQIMSLIAFLLKLQRFIVLLILIPV